MYSENAGRDLIEIGVHATMAKVYGSVTAILVVNCIIQLVLMLFTSSVAVTMLLFGITVGMVIFMIVTECTVKADKISRKEAGIIA